MTTTQTDTPRFETAQLKLRCGDEFDSGCRFYAGWDDRDAAPDAHLAPELAQQRINQLWQIGLQHTQDTGHVVHITQRSVGVILPG